MRWSRSRSSRRSCRRSWTRRPRWTRPPAIHAELGDNLAFERRLDAGAVDAAFAEADEVVAARFRFGRHTGVTLEARAIVADWNKGEQRLTVYQGSQAPHMMQSVYAQHLGLEESQVRVVCKDVGGSFGIKIHVYPDDLATAALSRHAGAPGASSSPTGWRVSSPISTPGIMRWMRASA